VVIKRGVKLLAKTTKTKKEKGALDKCFSRTNS